MNLLRSRTAVSPLRRDLAGGAPPLDLPAVDDLVAVERPEVPMHCLRPAVIAEAARAFVSGFPGRDPLRREVQPGTRRAARPLGRRRAPFRLRLRGRGRAGPRHVPGGRHPLHAPGEGPLGHPRGVEPPRRARLRARQRRGAGEDPGRNRRRRARRTTSAWWCAWRCPRARPCTTSPASSARRRTRRRRCSARPVRTRPGWASPSTSARSAWSRWRGGARSRWRAR